MNDILNQKLKVYREKIDDIVGELHQLTKDIGHEELSKTVGDLRNRITEPFMFVIVGEVKAGKSSFINALLDTGKEICKVAAHPMTDTIQQIVYGEKEDIVVINPYLKRIHQPVEILREIAIVDTPGTNTIVDHHQEITESFIPASDLIVFVFESKNPYRQSSWEFFDYIHADWRKKIIFILQQKDLMEPDDLVTNINGVKEHAIKKGISAPNVFAVSAKDELNGRHDTSNFSAVKDYIKTHITGGKAPILKQENNIETSKNINERIYKGLLIRKEQWKADSTFRTDIQQTLDQQEIKSNNQVDILVENLLAAYDRITLAKEKELNEGLAFLPLIKRSFGSLFSKGNSAKDWLGQLEKDLESDFNQTLRDKLDDGVIDIADSIQQMAKMIDLKIRNSHTILKDNHEIFSDIAERRSSVLKDLQKAFSSFLNRSENFTDEAMFSGKDELAPNLATGTGIAIVGAILTALTNGAVFDITGGILTAVGLLFAGVSVGLQRKKIIKGYQEEIAKGRVKLQAEVSEKLKAYVGNIKRKIDSNFNEFDILLQNEEKQIVDLESKHTSIENRLEQIKVDLNQLVV